MTTLPMNSPQSTHASTAAVSHTPGFTWRWTGSADADYIEVRTKLGRLFARLPSVDRAAISKGERAAYEANARLIAAAPELLEALKRAEQCLNLTRIQFMQAPVSASLPTTAASIGDDLFAVRSAIAKATRNA